MKKTAIYVAAMAFLFVFSSGISKSSSHRTMVSGKSWFVTPLSFYPLPNQDDPSLYSKTSVNYGCSDATGEVCQVYATENGNTGHPTQESLDSIMVVSNNF